MLTGSSQEIADQLYELFREAGVIKTAEER